MKLRSKLFAMYVAFVGLYSWFLLAAPPSRVAVEQYHLSSLKIRLLYLSIIAPLALIWFAAFYGYAKLKQYAELIKKSKDGAQVSRITIGLGILAVGMPTANVLGSFLTLIKQSADLDSNFNMVIRHYADVAIPLAAFFVISMGARGLSRVAKQQMSLRANHALTLIAITIGIIYTYIVVNSNNFPSSYFIPEWAVILTLVIPYVFTWYLGLQAAYEIHLYSKTVAGIVYRRTWNRLALGMGAIILTSITYQYVAPLTRQLTSLRLAWLLLIVYILLALMAVSYILVALGAKKLKKIEEV